VDIGVIEEPDEFFIREFLLKLFDKKMGINATADVDEHD
jgi:hypothetical protein